MKSDRPVGILKFHHIEIKENQQHAIFYKVYFEDEMGDIWMTESATFKFDLKLIK